jgi:hypothetical protein
VGGKYYLRFLSILPSHAVHLACLPLLSQLEKEGNGGNRPAAAQEKRRSGFRRVLIRSSSHSQPLRRHTEVSGKR